MFRIVESLLNVSKAGFASTAPAFVTAEAVSSRLIIDNMASVRPSESLSMTLPVKTIRHDHVNCAGKNVAPSTFPMKFRKVISRSNGNASFVRSFPLASSSPMLISPTTGPTVPNTARE